MVVTVNLMDVISLAITIVFSIPLILFIGVVVAELIKQHFGKKGKKRSKKGKK